MIKIIALCGAQNVAAKKRFEFICVCGREKKAPSVRRALLLSCFSTKSVLPYCYQKGACAQKEKIMFCAFCGKQISDTAKFCPACGKATGVGAPVNAPVSAPVPQPAPAPAPIPVPAPAPQGGPCCHVCRTPIPCGDTCPNCGAKLPVPGPGTTWADVMEAERHAKAKKKKAWLIAGCVLGGLVALVLIALLLLRFLGIGGGMLGSAEDTPAEEAPAEEAALTYNEGMNGGGDAYDSGDYETALEYYLAALDAAEGGEEELNARSCLART